MSQIATLRARVGGATKDIRVYSLDDPNIQYKGVRIQTPKGVGCLNFVSSGGDIPGVRVQTGSGVRHLKSYAYVEYVDVIKNASCFSTTYDPNTPESIYFNGLTWNTYSYGILYSDGPLTRVVSATFKLRLNSSNSNSANYLNRRFYLFYYSQGSMRNSNAYVLPTEIDTYYEVVVNFPGEISFDVVADKFRFCFVPESGSGSFNSNNDCREYSYKENTTVYH